MLSVVRDRVVWNDAVEFGSQHVLTVLVRTDRRTLDVVILVAFGHRLEVTRTGNPFAGTDGLDEFERHAARNIIEVAADFRR